MKLGSDYIALKPLIQDLPLKINKMFTRINERASAKKVLFTIYELRKAKVKFPLQFPLVRFF